MKGQGALKVTEERGKMKTWLWEGGAGGGSGSRQIIAAVPVHYSAS